MGFPFTFFFSSITLKAIIGKHTGLFSERYKGNNKYNAKGCNRPCMFRMKCDGPILIFCLIIIIITKTDHPL
uniref:Uncharacterized protein n=1 Tax=Rhizophora mucronata TaxID=61149 RepID=A0A2P2Q4P1_RHIMU